MEVVEQLDYLVTNAEVMELLRNIDAEAKSAGFMRPRIARETSKQVVLFPVLSHNVMSAHYT